jgi:hypothetical protein
MPLRGTSPRTSRTFGIVGRIGRNIGVGDSFLTVSSRRVKLARTELVSTEIRRKFLLLKKLLLSQQNEISR